MTKFYYGKTGKLVRDKIPSRCEKEGHVVKVRRLSGRELATAIIGKIPEEMAELLVEYQNGDVGREMREVADLTELIRSYIIVRGLDPDKIEEIRQQKADERGAFIEGYWQEWIDLDDDTADGQRLLAMFRKQPKKYIEEQK